VLACVVHYALLFVLYVVSHMQGPGSDSISKGSYAKIFRDVIWEAALDGCRGRSNPAAGQQQQQEQGGPGPQSSSTTAPSGSGQLCYDAVVTVGSPIAAQMTLNFLHQAEKMQKAKLPVVVQYTVSAMCCAVLCCAGLRLRC